MLNLVQQANKINELPDPEMKGDKKGVFQSPRDMRNFHYPLADFNGLC